MVEREKREGEGEMDGVWGPPRGGASRVMVGRMIGVVLEGGVVGEVLDGLEGVEVG